MDNTKGIIVNIDDILDGVRFQLATKGISVDDKVTYGFRNLNGKSSDVYMIIKSKFTQTTPLDLGELISNSKELAALKEKVLRDEKVSKPIKKASPKPQKSSLDIEGLKKTIKNSLKMSDCFFDASKEERQNLLDELDNYG